MLSTFKKFLFYSCYYNKINTSLNTLKNYIISYVAKVFEYKYTQKFLIYYWKLILVSNKPEVIIFWSLIITRQIVTCLMCCIYIA